MSACPHCSQPIEKLDGFVKQEVMRQRLDAKKGEIDALTTEVTGLRTKAAGFDAIVTERDGLRSELDGMKQRETRLTALDCHKLDRGLLEHVEVLYKSATAGDEEPQAFDAWLEEHGQVHPLLAPHLGKADPTTTPAPAPADPPATPGDPAPPPRTAPTEPPATPPPGPGGKMTPQDVRTYFQSPEFLAMDGDAKRAKIAELKGQVAGQNPTGLG
ncbi:MAG: hypothetical protein AAF602_33270 [Myxococcota bacterium]